MGGVYNSSPVAFNHPIPNGQTHYFEIPCSAAPWEGIQIVWHDAASAFTAAVQSTNRPPLDAPTSSLNAEHWSAEAGIVIAAVTAGAPGSKMVHVTNFAAKRMRLALTATAASLVSIYTHGKA